MGCCASSDNIEKPGALGPNRSPPNKPEQDPNAKKVNAPPLEDPISTGSNPKSDGGPINSKEVKLDLNRVVKSPRASEIKGKTNVYAKPDETPSNKQPPQPKSQESQQKTQIPHLQLQGSQSKVQDFQLRGHTPQNRQSTGKPTDSTKNTEHRSTPVNQDQKKHKTHVVGDPDATDQAKRTDNKGSSQTQVNAKRDTDASPKKSVGQNTPVGKNLATLDMAPSKERVSKKTDATPSSKNDVNSLADLKKGGSLMKSTGDMKISPDIFVSLKTGAISDFYKVGQILGEGAYGKVSTVIHKTTGIVRAMKSINKKTVVKEEAEKLFNEVSILKELDHPNIVKLYELFQDDSCYYLVTEYCTGGELFDRIQQMQSFSEKQASEYMKQLLSAIVYIHSRNIVHRDLKPENLLLDSKKPDAALKVIDFGTSGKFEPGKRMTKKFGTPYYIAPEVLAKNYDEKCDVWSAGVILYILLCGYPPFNGRNDAEIINKVKSGKFVFDESDWSRVSVEAKNLIKKMLTLDPAHRISAREALEDPWMKKNDKVRPFSKKTLENLSSFSSKNKLKQAILTFIVTQVTTQAEREELQRTFQQLDRDGNGTLTKDELVEGYIKVFGVESRQKAEQEAAKIIKEVDVNDSGQIDFTEFIMAAMNKEMLLSKQKMAQAFKLFDLNGDGFITKQELASVMGGVELNEDDWKQIIGEVDQNSDGKISEKEFVELLTKTAKPVKKGSKK